MWSSLVRTSPDSHKCFIESSIVCYSCLQFVELIAVIITKVAFS